ncbi:hypothetical protein PSHT_14898 [Puccinia striiformis]|uniref:Uncharacterized protein n=1 Tax=Puccinia striiformis TaxID=27350 RepID=A0A2S4UHQ0_9BASI|nr:hypothetical protein PSHT_14898 [Puccinia striiformis]
MVNVLPKELAVRLGLFISSPSSVAYHLPDLVETNERTISSATVLAFEIHILVLERLGFTAPRSPSRRISSEGHSRPLHGLIITECSMNLKGIGGLEKEILGITEGVRIRIGNIKRSVHFWILSGNMQPIPGKPFSIDVSASMKYVEGGGETLSINDDKGRTYLVSIITPSNQKWETTFPTNTTSTSNAVTARGSSGGHELKNKTSEGGYNF